MEHTPVAPDASDADLIAAAQMTGADNFIGMLPGGFDFPLSERGQELSVGMRQSVAISRALISKPNILILDEPTAPLDNSSEAALVQKLSTATKGVTCIFATHRGAMLQMANKVVVMDRGRVVMAGPRDKVLAELQGDKK